MTSATSIIPHIIDQHAEEAAFLWLLRDNAVTDPHYNVDDLQDLESRIEAHIDGLRIAGDEGWLRALENLEQFKESGEMFAAATLAFESTDADRLKAIYSLAQANPETERGLVAALGWVEPKHLEGKVSGLLSSGSSFWRRIGIAACAIHRVDPGKHLIQGIQDEDQQLVSRSLKAASELGRTDLLETIVPYLRSDDDEVRFRAAWSSVLLGDRENGLAVLRNFVLQSEQFAKDAAKICCRCCDLPDSQQVLGTLVREQGKLRRGIQGAGMTGDPRYIPWLIEQMETAEVACVAGESFSLITGIDLAYDDLEADQPDGFQTGPTESPEDEDTELDPDENLPWPDPQLIRQWWEAHQGRYTSGQRYLMGQLVTRQQCQQVLKTGFQRQRQAAALELALMEPASMLFETRAKAKRQLVAVSP